MHDTRNRSTHFICGLDAFFQFLKRNGYLRELSNPSDSLTFPFLALHFLEEIIPFTYSRLEPHYRRLRHLVKRSFAQLEQRDFQISASHPLNFNTVYSPSTLTRLSSEGRMLWPLQLSTNLFSMRDGCRILRDRFPLQF
jgi:hypothetical protein